nr:DciA family protein [Nocardioides thalensis]
MLGSEVARIIEERGWGLDLQVRAVFARWGEIVGPEIGAHSTPEALTDGTLVVRTDSTAWATQLKLLAASLVKRLNAELGDGTVTVVEVLGPTAPSWKHGRLGTRDGRGPRDTYG